MRALNSESKATDGRDDVVDLTGQDDLDGELLEGSRQPVDGSSGLSGRNDVSSSDLESLIGASQEVREESAESLSARS